MKKILCFLFGHKKNNGIVYSACPNANYYTGVFTCIRCGKIIK